MGFGGSWRPIALARRAGYNEGGGCDPRRPPAPQGGQTVARQARNTARFVLPLGLALVGLGCKEMTSMAGTATLSRAVPPMDAAAPEVTETATFALG